MLFSERGLIQNQSSYSHPTAWNIPTSKVSISHNFFATVSVCFWNLVFPFVYLVVLVVEVIQY